MKELKIILGPLLFSIQAIGCDCIMVPLDKQFSDAEYVLRIRVIGLLDTKQERIDYHFPDTSDNRSYRARVEIITIYKGTVIDKTINIATAYTNCEPYYELAKEYLLFINKADDKFFVIPCTSWTDNPTRRTLRKMERLARNKTATSKSYNSWRHVG